MAEAFPSKHLTSDQCININRLKNKPTHLSSHACFIL
jgi:hypothetical protein